jgi:hypothetical protein
MHSSLPFTVRDPLYLAGPVYGFLIGILDPSLAQEKAERSPNATAS